MKKARCPQNRGEVDDNREKVVADLSSLTPEVEVRWAMPQPSGSAPCCAMDLSWAFRKDVLVDFSGTRSLAEELNLAFSISVPLTERK